MKIDNVKNVKFKSTFVINNLSALRKQYGFQNRVIKRITVAMRDGPKCHCCSLGIHFRLEPKDGMVMYSNKDKPMTLDHDLLNSLEGSNDVSNQHLLCYQCNQMRGNRFAEYSEFKSWYDNCIKKNLNPFAEINKVKKNFSYLDLSKNGFKKEVSKSIPLNYHSTMPALYKQALIKHITKHTTFIPHMMPFKLSDLTNLSSTAWDGFINDLLVHLFQVRISEDIERPTKQYGLINNRTAKSMEKLTGKLNNLIKTEYTAIRNEMKLKGQVPSQRTVIIPVKKKVSWFNWILSKFNLAIV